MQSDNDEFGWKGEPPVKWKALVLSIWDWIDPVYYFSTRLQKISKENRSIFRVRLMKYRGRIIELQDGTRICPSDMLLKIHLHNVKLLKEIMNLKGDVRKGRHLYRATEAALPYLAAYLRQHPKCNEIKAILGITMINRGTGSLGFQVVPIANRWYGAFKWIILFPIYLLSVSHPVRSFKKCHPVYLIMSRDTLFEKYG